MKKRIKGKFAVSVVLLITVILGLTFSMVPAGAATPVTVVGFAGKQWNVMTNSGSRMTLILANGSYFNDLDSVFCKYNDHYSMTILDQQMLKAFKTVSAEEQSLVVARDLDGSPGPVPKGKSFWALSKAEYDALDPSLRVFSNSWWLRSTLWDASQGKGESGQVYYVDADGSLKQGSSNGSGRKAVRPGFELNLDSQLFASNADNSVKGVSVAPTSHSLAGSGAQKFTVVTGDTAMVNLGSASLDKTSVAAGENVTISYNGAVAGSNKYVSTIVVNGSGEAVSYAKVATNASGTAQMTIPTGIASGNYTVRVFNEVVNGANFTDFASNPKDIAITVSGDAPAAGNQGQNTGGGVNTNIGNGQNNGGVNGWSSGNGKYSDYGDYMGEQGKYPNYAGYNGADGEYVGGSGISKYPNMGGGDYVGGGAGQSANDGATTGGSAPSTPSNISQGQSSGNSGATGGTASGAGSSTTQMEILSGGNQTWSGGNGSVSVRVNAEFSTFQSVSMDGATLESSNYTASEGSTIITFGAAYLNTLGKGDHTITINFKDGGYAQTKLSVGAATATGGASASTRTANPQTGNMSFVWIWAIVFISAAISLFVVKNKKVRSK